MRLFIISLISAATIGHSYATMAQLSIKNNSSRVFLTHCVHYQPEEGKWMEDGVSYKQKYDNNMSFSINLDGKGYFACEVYATKKSSTVNLLSSPLGVSVGDLGINIQQPFPIGNVYTGSSHDYKAEITNTGSDSHTIHITLPELPSGISITHESTPVAPSGNCWDGRQGVTLNGGQMCYLNLGLSINKPDISVNKNWEIGFLGQKSLIEKLNFDTLDNHGSAQVAMLEVRLENDKSPLVNWLPFDRRHANQMEVSQMLDAHLVMDSTWQTITIVN